ncbi:alpha/beta hydrolase [Streptomyces sp. NBC_00988]|uniref:alpha/beta fold hydrolase n=1 Tax=Streptomyces sp. NBC_00988 TaxID=2903704 RepID=UPI00386361F1|nr:alpha/beta hydrolase [Streptomyces sp. NBC_00988]
MASEIAPGDGTPDLDGFEHCSAAVNGTRLHYVDGGSGEPLFLLPGWPMTWWEFHKMMPALARRYRVIAVDIRGMGGSAKPESGYSKKTMARDILELVRLLGFERINIAGEDIGGMVAYSFAMNHPEHVSKLALWETSHPNKRLYEFSMMPQSSADYYPWWISLNFVDDLPERLLAGRFRTLLDWMIDHHTRDPSVIDERSREIYACAYEQPGAVRAGNGWYQSWPQDITDREQYRRFEGPVLVMGGRNFTFIQGTIDDLATDITKVQIEGGGHFLAEERPEDLVRELFEFLGRP